MAKKFGKILLGATLVAGATAAAYWYKKNHIGPQDNESDDFDDDLENEILNDFADCDEVSFEEEELPRHYVPIKLKDEASDDTSGDNDDENAITLDDIDYLDEPDEVDGPDELDDLDDLDDLDVLDDDDLDDFDDDDLDDFDEELLDSLAEEALETLQDI